MSDPTDPGGVGAAQAERASSRYARVGDNGSPVGSPLTIILAVVAVVVGFLIFRTIDSGGSNAGGLPDTDITTPVQTDATGNTVTTQPGGATSVAPTTTVAVDKTAADVVVINAAEVGGAAATVTDLIKGAGFTTVEAVSDADDTADAETIVYFTASAPASEGVARALAALLGVTRVEAAPDAGIPLADGDSAGTATVFVWLGTDNADMTALPTATTQPTVNTPAATTTTTGE